MKRKAETQLTNQSPSIRHKEPKEPNKNEKAVQDDATTESSSGKRPKVELKKNLGPDFIFMKKPTAKKQTITKDAIITRLKRKRQHVHKKMCNHSNCDGQCLQSKLMNGGVGANYDRAYAKRLSKQISKKRRVAKEEKVKEAEKKEKQKERKEIKLNYHDLVVDLEKKGEDLSLEISKRIRNLLMGLPDHHLPQPPHESESDNSIPMLCILYHLDYREEDNIPVLRLTGATQYNTDVVVHIYDFEPYFYWFLPAHWCDIKAAEKLIAPLRPMFKKTGVTKLEIIKAKTIREFCPDDKFNLALKLTVQLPKNVTSTRTFIYDAAGKRGVEYEAIGGNYSEGNRKEGELDDNPYHSKYYDHSTGSYNKKRNSANEFKQQLINKMTKWMDDHFEEDEKIQLFECGFEFPFRYLMDARHKGFGWFELKENKYTFLDPNRPRFTSFSGLEVKVSYKDIKTMPAEEPFLKLVRMRMISLDIECAGMSKSFPKAEKDPIVIIGVVLGDDLDPDAQKGRKSRTKIAFVLDDVEEIPETLCLEYPIFPVMASNLAENMDTISSQLKLGLPKQYFEQENETHYYDSTQVKSCVEIDWKVLDDSTVCEEKNTSEASKREIPHQLPSKEVKQEVKENQSEKKDKQEKLEKLKKKETYTETYTESRTKRKRSILDHDDAQQEEYDISQGKEVDWEGDEDMDEKKQHKALKRIERQHKKIKLDAITPPSVETKTSKKEEKQEEEYDIYTSDSDTNSDTKPSDEEEIAASSHSLPTTTKWVHQIDANNDEDSEGEVDEYWTSAEPEQGVEFKDCTLEMEAFKRQQEKKKQEDEKKKDAKELLDLEFEGDLMTQMEEELLSKDKELLPDLESNNEESISLDDDHHTLDDNGMEKACKQIMRYVRRLKLIHEEHSRIQGMTKATEEDRKKVDKAEKNLDKKWTHWKKKALHCIDVLSHKINYSSLDKKNKKDVKELHTEQYLRSQKAIEIFLSLFSNFDVDPIKWKAKDPEWIKARTERESEMLIDFWAFMRVTAHPAVTSYNGEGFDWPYLLDRGAALNLDKYTFASRIVERAQYHNVKFISKGTGARELVDVDLPGSVYFDALRMLRKACPNEESYTLNNMSKKYLKNEKLEMPWQFITPYHLGTAKHRADLAAYCVKDCVLPLDLIDKLQLIYTRVALCRVTGLTPTLGIRKGQSAGTMSQLIPEIIKQHLLMPYNQRTEEGIIPDDDDTAEEYITVGKEKGYEGATVIYPRRGFYDCPIVCLDFSSLYPSIMIDNNLCFTTVITWKRIQELGLKPEDYICRVINNETQEKAYFVKRHIRVGVLPTLLKALIKARKKVKDSIPEGLSESSVEYAVKNGLQNAIKVAANSVYGFCGQGTQDKRIAAMVTALAREALQTAIRLTRQTYPDCQIVYGDTDSIMIKFGTVADETDPAKKRKREITMEEAADRAVMLEELITNYFRQQFDGDNKLYEDKRKEECKEKGETYNEKDKEKGVMAIAFEKIMMPFLLMNPKKYVAIKMEGRPKYTKIDKKTGKEEVIRSWDGNKFVGNPKKRNFFARGIETVRRDNPYIVRELMKQATELMFQYDEDKKRYKIEEAMEMVRQEAKRLLCGNVWMYEIVVTKCLAKMRYEPPEPAHVVLARRMHKRNPATAPKKGDRMKIVYIKQLKKAKASERAEDPLYALDHDLDIDYEYYFENLFRAPFERLFAFAIQSKAQLKENLERTYTPSDAEDKILVERAYALSEKKLWKDVKKSISVKKSSTLQGKMGKWFKAASFCLGCKVPLVANRVVCDDCEPKRPVLVKIHDRTMEARTKLKNELINDCVTCSAGKFDWEKCENGDCHKFWKRAENDRRWKKLMKTDSLLKPSPCGKTLEW